LLLYHSTNDKMESTNIEQINKEKRQERLRAKRAYEKSLFPELVDEFQEIMEKYGLLPLDAITEAGIYLSPEMFDKALKYLEKLEGSTGTKNNIHFAMLLLKLDLTDERLFKLLMVGNTIKEFDKFGLHLLLNPNQRARINHSCFEGCTTNSVPSFIPIVSRGQGQQVNYRGPIDIPTDVLENIISIGRNNFFKMTDSNGQLTDLNEAFRSAFLLVLMSVIVHFTPTH